MPDANIKDAVLYPIAAQVATNTRVASALVYEGGTYWAFRDIEFNRILVEITSVTASPTMAMQIFQFDGGEMNDGTNVAPRLLNIQNQALVSGLNTLTVPTTTIEEGFVFVGVGRDGGTSFTSRGHSGITAEVWNNPGVAPAFPLLFSYGNPAAPPATLNLAAVSSLVSNQSIVIRLLKV